MSDMFKIFKQASDKSDADESVLTKPRVTRVTPEGEVAYDPLSVIRSGPAREHLKEIEK